MGWTNVVIFLGLAHLTVTDNVCQKSKVVNGVPIGAKFNKAAVFKNFTFSECTEKCCANPACEVAIMHNNFCFQTSCQPACDITKYTVDEADPAAQFVLVTRTDPEDTPPQDEDIPEKDEASQKETGEDAPNEEDPVDETDQKNTQIGAESSGNPDLASPENEDGSPEDEDGSPEDVEEVSSDTTPECGEKCEANGECVEVEGVSTCKCKAGYKLEDGACIPIVIQCTVSACTGAHTECKIVNNKIMCPCHVGYTPSDTGCIAVSCTNVTCPHHSTCSVTGGTPHCFCDKGYVAQDEFCREDIKCTVEPKNEGCPENEHCQQVSGKTHCYCKPGKLRARGSGDCSVDAGTIVLTAQNTTVTQPQDTAMLTVTVSPPHVRNANYYTYKWALQTGPKGGDTGMEGLTTAQVKISKLMPGSYVFLLTVVGTHNELQTKVVSLLVIPPPHKNIPPLAIIKPGSELTFKLPADFSLNGISSTDDDKIVSYKWTIEAQPTASTGSVEQTGENTDTLHVKIKNGEGKFTFKLVVKDEAGLEATANKSVLILAEDDFPPSAKVSAPQVITLPNNTVTLDGNESTDDHGIVRWEWQKSNDSPSTADLQGSTQPVLTLSKLVEGTYTFTLTVYDKKGQDSTASTTVTVRPAEKGPPVARAGDSKELVQPDSSTELDGSKSTSPLGPLVRYKWEKVSGPAGVAMSTVDEPRLTVSGLEIGSYKFKLTVTDKNNQNATDEVTITVKEDDNLPPVARLAPLTTIYLPFNSVDIDGSQSTDDKKIARWEWSRSGSSPALGGIVGNSAMQPVLKLCDLIIGTYTFTLTVFDEKELSCSASTTVKVAANPNATDIIQVYLYEDPSNFTQDRLLNLRNILMVPFSVDRDRSVAGWELRTMTVKSVNNQVVVYFYGVDETGERMAGAPLVKQLRNTVYGKILGFDFDVIDTATCSNVCSGHGMCNTDTRLCKCNKF